jgi:hypothetical protein
MFVPVLDVRHGSLKDLIRICPFTCRDLIFLISSSSVMNLWMAGVVGMRNLVGRWG